MREIKFRGLSINGTWHYGLLTILKEKNGLTKEGCYISNRVGMPFAYHVRPDSVGQFTGLRDKNGKEIYEGDAVRILYSDWPSKSNSDPRTLEQYLIDISIVGKIVFDVYEWRVEFSEDSSGRIMPGTHGQITVIGNIHESPSLLPTTDKK